MCAQLCERKCNARVANITLFEERVQKLKNKTSGLLQKCLLKIGFIADVESWLKTNFVGENDDDVDEEVHLDDSVSNVASRNGGQSGDFRCTDYWVARKLLEISMYSSGLQQWV